MKHYCLIFLLIVFTPVLANADYNANDDAAAAALQANWYPGANGLWNSEPWWNQAEVLESMLNTVQRTNGQSYMSIINPAWSGNSSYNFITNSNDDTEWWGNVWMRGFDLTGNVNYLNTSKAIFNEILTQWDTSNCGGGVWWNQPGTYKNAVTNELFLLLCTRLHQRTPGDTNYLNWATSEWNWFNASGMINGANLINDGLTSTCANNGQTTWTYNQGVILAGLTELYKITGNTAYLTKAESIANSVMANMVDGNGILYEPCGTGCNGDQVQFKGIFMRYLFTLYDEDHKAAYYNFLAKNAQSVWNNDRNSSNLFGSLWSGPVDSTDPTRQNSGMDPGSVIADPWTSTMTFARGSQDPEFNHNVGYAVGSLGWACDPTNNPSSGFMQWGPYVSYLSTGTHVIHFRLAVNSLSASTASLVTLQVTTNNGGTYLGTLDVPWNAFTQTGVPQDFALTVNNGAAGEALEFRANWNAVAGGPQVILTDTTVDGGYNWVASNLSHSVGRLDGVNNWGADSNRDGSGYMIQGPGTAELGGGSCQAVFELKVDNFNWDSNTVATISVVDDDTSSTVASQNITRNQFSSILFQNFTLNFTSTAGHHYDYRVYYDSFANGPRLTARGIYVSVLNPAPPCGTTVANFDNGSNTDNLGGYISLSAGGSGCSTTFNPSNAAPSAGYGLGGSSQGERWYGTIGTQGTCYGPSMLVGLGSGTPSYNASSAGQNAEVFHIRINAGPASGPATVYIGVIPTNGTSSGFQYNLVIPPTSFGLDLPQTVYLSQMAHNYGPVTSLDTTQLYQLYYEPGWTGNYDLTVDQIAFACAVAPTPTATFTATPTFTHTMTPTPTFTSTTTPPVCASWVVNGNAALGTAVTLTTAANSEAGSAWNSTTIDLTKSFNMTFKAYFGAAGGADGIDFVLHNDPRGTTALGSGGGNKGYSGGGVITPSVAFDLETYSSNGTLQMMENGANTCTYAAGTCPYVFPSNISNSAEHTYQVAWSATAKQLMLIVDGTVVMVYNRDLVASVFSGNSKVYYGFTAGTGGSNNLQYVYEVSCVNATPTFTSTLTSTVTATYTSTPTLTVSLTPTNTYTLTSSPTNTFSPTVTYSATNTPTILLSATATSILTSTATPTLTLSATPTLTPSGTATAMGNATFSNTTTATYTASFSPTGTAPVNTATLTGTQTATDTLTRTASPTITVTNTYTATQPLPTSTKTFTASATSTNSFTATSTFSLTATNIRTATGTPTASPSATSTATLTFTPTPTFTRTLVPTATSTPTLTRSFTPTLTFTPTQAKATATFTSTAAPICSGVPVWNGNFAAYTVGQKVNYNGEVYQCIQSHTSEPNWMPPVVPALWKDLGPCGSVPTPLAVAQPVVYPNPVTSDTVNLQLPVNNAANVTVEIYTTAFRGVKTTHVQQVGGNIMTIELIDKAGVRLADGLYYFVIQANGQRWTNKVLVLR